MVEIAGVEHNMEIMALVSIVMCIVEAMRSVYVAVTGL
jgi:hypothetical protein